MSGDDHLFVDLVVICLQLFIHLFIIQAVIHVIDKKIIDMRHKS